MARLLWAVTAQRIITDGESNSVSYIDLVESLAVSVFPTVLPPVQIGTLWQRENEEPSFAMRLVVLAPDGEVLAPLPVLPSHQFGANSRYRVNLGIGGLPLKMPGIYKFRIDVQRGLDWSQAGELQLDVVHLPANAPTARSVHAPASTGRH